jgi:hypothetical protein
VGENKMKGKSLAGTAHIIKYDENPSQLPHFEQKQWEYVTDCLRRNDDNFSSETDAIGSKTNIFKTLTIHIKHQQIIQS